MCHWHSSGSLHTPQSALTVVVIVVVVVVVTRCGLVGELKRDSLVKTKPHKVVASTHVEDSVASEGIDVLVEAGLLVLIQT